MAYKTLEANERFVCTTKRMAQLVDQAGNLVDEIKPLQEELDETKLELRGECKKQYFNENEGTNIVPHTYDVAGRSYIAQINFVDKYHLNKQRFESLRNALNNKEFNKFFKQKTVVKLDTTNVTDDEAFLNDLRKLCRKHGAKAQASYAYEVAATFHTDRHLLPKAFNKRIDEILPIEVAVTI